MSVLLSILPAVQPAWPQFSRFGVNKVQFTEFTWQKLETPNFDLYFYVEEELLAGIAAEMAEAQYERLERLFGHSVERRIPLIVYSSHIYFEQTNIIPGILPEGVGGFMEFLKGRVALPLSGSLPEFERVLAHELIHVFTFDRIRQVLGRHGTSRIRIPPLWLTEGLAEYWAGPWDTEADMILRDAIFAQRLISIEHMHHIDGSYLMYKKGQSICAYMAETYGEDIFERLFTNWWRGDDFAAIFEAVTGDPLSKLDTNWQYAQRKRYLPDITRGDLPSHAARQLTTEGFNTKPAVLTGTDSTAFLYFRNTRGYTHIARTTLPDGETRVVDAGERSPAIESLHPMRSRLAIDAEGTRLAFAAKQRGRDRLFIQDLGTGETVHDLAFDSVIAITSPSWSPDGRRLAFSGADSGGKTDLYLYDLDTGTLRRLTHDLYHDHDLVWSPAGDHLVFVSDRCVHGRTGQYSLFLMELPGGRILQLTRGEHSDIHPAWSVDGRYIAFSSDRNGIHNIHALRLETAEDSGDLWRSEPERLTRVLTGAFAPAWLDNGQGLLYTGYENGSFQIFTAEVEPEALDRLAAVHSIPAAPDSAWLAGIVAPQPAYNRQDYERQLSLDIAQSQISQDPQLGTSGGIQLALSDILGNEHYYFVLAHVAGSQTGILDGLNVAMAHLQQGSRINRIWGLYRYNERLNSRYGRYVREKRTGGFLELEYPFSRHDRLEVRLSLRQARIDRELEGRRLDGWLVSNMISYTHDNSLWIPTGPLEGQRYSMGLAQTVDLRTSRRYNTTIFGDYRRYFRLSRRSALATRIMARRSHGDVPEYFALGGSWTLRGYPWLSIWGNKMILANTELRFPLVDQLAIRFPFGTMDFRALRGAMFVDAGNAWENEFGSWRGSVGAGVRLALGGAFVFRLDGARRTDFRSLGRETHWDFFFGWDF